MSTKRINKTNVIKTASRVKDDIVDSYDFVQKATATSFQDILPGVSSRDGFDRGTYNYFRPGEAKPSDQLKLIQTCNSAYKSIPIVKNVIDTMGDFSTQGIRWVHPDSQVQKFYNDWFAKVKGADRSERFCNLLFREGNVVLRRLTAKITVKQERLMRGKASPELIIENPLKMEKREIPWKYVFYNPTSLEILGNEIATFVGERKYKLKLPSTLVRKVAEPTEEEKSLVDKLPKDIKDAASNSTGQSAYIILDPLNTLTFFYKKDDWEAWADPIIAVLLPDLAMLEKHRLADSGALDGAISTIRLWKLGDPEGKRLPTPRAISRLSEMLQNNPGGGTMDLVWGVDIDCKTIDTHVHNFLGIEKYIPTLLSIHAGLGVPPSLTGSDSKTGFTNNAVAIQTLVDRLNYGRRILSDFWDGEAKLVAQAMGFKTPAKLKFNYSNFSDPAALRKFFLDLVDRDDMSWESLLENVGEYPEIEEARLKREKKRRSSDKLPKKASPWHNPQPENDLRKIMLQLGMVTPGQLGLELEEPIAGEKTFLEMKGEMDKQMQESKKLSGIPGQGRPKGQKDQTKRKQKTVKPRSFGSLNNVIWAIDIQKTISNIVTPHLLRFYNKDNLRQLTTAEYNTVEDVKFALLCTLNFGDEVTEQTALTTLSLAPSVPEKVYNFYRQGISDWKLAHKKEPKVEDERNIKAIAYTLYMELLNEQSSD